ncbi:MAG: 50S ribosomal protein L19 [Candidatus Staskawiczbacteria bacterium CG10_big_fil_rev_8_21_14_0_10_38_10]|uniref:Large ribosomal subunit protein bL19 n=1 Tax=Candidatus Staskawiczbacteria bacterium CG10_big_fil_rev_8_21_14_0_10_38_10 TaxID=1974891 RepID=A0A2H9T1P5_9BACT|nr:MAG: 50S ribosomal protein L19 [Candidatus Staskawiczbacteria bacterium CG10_big_fil_rev_8_21_14_0_10_38_10]
MATKIEIFNQTQLKKDLPDIRPGDTVRVYQKIREGDKERIQVFEGVVLARKHGKGVSATITVRKDFSGIGVERVFPIHSPVIDRFEVEKRGKVRRAKIYYLRTAKGDRAKLKKRKISAAAAGESRREDAEEKKE